MWQRLKGIRLKLELGTRKADVRQFELYEVRVPRQCSEEMRDGLGDNLDVK